MRASCGAQPILEMATVYSNLKDAIQDCDEAVAFARWHGHSRQYTSLSDMIVKSSFLSRKGRLALVYGREVGMLSLVQSMIQQLSLIDSVALLNVSVYRT